MSTTLIPKQCIRVIAEPGDMTRYDFVFVQDETDFCITPFKNTFLYPQKLSIFEIEEIETLEIAQSFIKGRSNLENVNPHTLFQICKILKEYYYATKNN